jgi:hypothetical protein
MPDNSDESALETFVFSDLKRCSVEQIIELGNLVVSAKRLVQYFAVRESLCVCKYVQQTQADVAIKIDGEKQAEQKAH